MFPSRPGIWRTTTVCWRHASAKVSGVSSLYIQPVVHLTKSGEHTGQQGDVQFAIASGSEWRAYCRRQRCVQQIQGVGKARSAAHPHCNFNPC
ncbi:unnamed protein product [Victoria cruziana]